MRKRIGISCIVLGMICLLASAGFVVYNRHEEKSGAQSAQNLLQDLQTAIEENTNPENALPVQILPEKTQQSEYREMPTVPAGDYESIGVLSIPVLEIELPVLTDWSYEKLKKAPCHYYGSYYEPDFVIAAHNFASHFGRLSQLQPGDLVIFTDATGENHYYEMVLLETLTPTATREMLSSGFDLSLYTCTPGGNNRVTVRCRAITQP